MSQVIHLEPSQVPTVLRGSYAGYKYKVLVCESVTIPATAGLWDSGSRDSYQGVELATGKRYPLTMENTSPWNGVRRDIEVQLDNGKAIVEHSIHCGKDEGLTFYIHPSNAIGLIPAKIELTPYQRLVLVATSSLKSSYAGRDRYQMANGEHHCMNALNGSDYPTRDQWREAQASLIAAGYLNKAGAITVKGRNAIS
jgi:hypothetical protein